MPGESSRGHSCIIRRSCLWLPVAGCVWRRLRRRQAAHPLGNAILLNCIAAHVCADHPHAPDPSRPHSYAVLGSKISPGGGAPGVTAAAGPRRRRLLAALPLGRRLWLLCHGEQRREYLPHVGTQDSPAGPK